MKVQIEPECTFKSKVRSQESWRPCEVGNTASWTELNHQRLTGLYSALLLFCIFILHPSSHGASNCVLCPVLSLRNTGTHRSGPSPHKDFRHWRDWQANYRCGPAACHRVREAAHSTPSMIWAASGGIPPQKNSFLFPPKVFSLKENILGLL